MRFQPERILRLLEDYQVRYVLIGGLASTLHGSPLRTGDVDICPARDAENLGNLSRALVALKARVRAADSSEGLPFHCDARFLEQVSLLNLVTEYGELDIVFEPAGTEGYDELAGDAERYDLDGLVVSVASLKSVIESKRSADRQKDRATLPTLEALLAERNRKG